MIDRSQFTPPQFMPPKTRQIVIPAGKAFQEGITQTLTALKKTNTGAPVSRIALINAACVFIDPDDIEPYLELARNVPLKNPPRTELSGLPHGGCVVEDIYYRHARLCAARICARYALNITTRQMILLSLLRLMSLPVETIAITMSQAPMIMLAKSP